MTRLVIGVLAVVGLVMAGACAVDDPGRAVGPDVPRVDRRAAPWPSFPVPPAANPDPVAQALSCPSTGSTDSDPVIAVTIDERIELLRADGSSETVFTFGGQTADLDVGYVSDLISSGSRTVAVAQLQEPRDGEGAYYYAATVAFEIVVLDAGGTAIWQRVLTPEDDNVYYVIPTLGEDGTLALDLSNETGLILLPSGDEVAVDLFPVAVMPDGRVVLEDRDNETYQALHEYWWFDPVSGTRSELGHSYVGNWGRPQVVGDWLIYFDSDDEQRTTVVAESASDLQTFVFEPAEDGYYGGVALLDAVAEGYLLLGRRWESDERFVADLAAGTLTRLDTDFPDGLSEFSWQGYYYVDPGVQARLDHTGAVLVGLRSDTSAALYRTADAGASWTTVGLETRGIDYVIGLGVGGSYVIEAAGTYAYNGEQWSEPDPGQQTALEGPSVQAYRPDSDVLVVLGAEDAVYGMGQLDIRPDGRCVAFWEYPTDGSSWRLSSIDLETGEQSTVLSLEPAGAPRFTWLAAGAPRPMHW